MGKRTRAALATVVSAAAVGGISAAPASADSVGGYQCGLTTDGYNYVIANCNTFAVSRRIVKADGSRGSCRHIDGRSWVVGSSSIRIIGYEGC